MSLSLHVCAKVLQQAVLVVVLSSSEIPTEKYIADLRIMDVESQQDLGRLLEAVIHVDLLIVTARSMPSLRLTRVDLSTSKENYRHLYRLILVDLKETRSRINPSPLLGSKRCCYLPSYGHNKPDAQMKEEVSRYLRPVCIITFQ